MGHLGVVLFNEELHQGAQSCEGIQRVEIQPLMLERAPERLNHGVGEADVDLRENAVKAGAEKGGVDRAVDVLHTGVSIHKRPACGDKMLAGGQENLDVTEIEGLWACLVGWRANDRRPGSPAQGAKTAGSRGEPSPLAAGFASQGRRMPLRVGERCGWQETIGAANTDSGYA